MSIKIVANGKIEVNNEKPILHFLTVYVLTVMSEIPCLELYISNLPVNTVKADNLPVAFRLQWYQNHSNFHCYQQIQSFLIMR
jgi:hypothetical protein